MDGAYFSTYSIQKEKTNSLLLVGGREDRIEDWMWIQLDLSLVQILVQVAIRKMKFLSVKVNNGLERMANDF